MKEASKKSFLFIICWIFIPIRSIFRKEERIWKPSPVSSVLFSMDIWIIIPGVFTAQTSTLSSHLLFPYYLGSRNSCSCLPEIFPLFSNPTSSVCKACYEEFFHIWESASAFILPAWEDGEAPSLYTSAPVSCGINYFPLDLKHSFSGPAKPLYLFSPESLAEILRASQDSAAASRIFHQKRKPLPLEGGNAPYKKCLYKNFFQITPLSITLPLKESKKLSVYLKESGTGFAFPGLFYCAFPGRCPCIPTSGSLVFWTGF